MTFQRRLLLGFALMTVPVLLVGAEAMRSNALERRALEALGQGLGRGRTYAEVETAMFNQSEVLWRALSGLEPGARREYALQGEVVRYWFERWRGELRPDERQLGENVRILHREIEQVGDSVFRLIDAGRREAGYNLARRELRYRLLPALTEVNHEIYRRAREYSVQRAFARVEEVVNAERRALLAILVLAAVLGPAAAWLIARGLARPIRELREAMAVVGAGDLDHPITARGGDEIGDLARSFAQMTGRLREARAEQLRLNGELGERLTQLERAQAQVVQSEKLASVGQMAAAVAHGLRNPLASLRASAQLALRHPDSPAAREQLHAMVEEVDRLDHRIGHLLAFSRPAPVRPLREPAGPLVEGLLPPLAHLLAERRVTLARAIAPGLPEILVDPVRVEQAVTEVVANALDAMPQGGTLTVGARVEPGADGAPCVAITIGDTGPGIPPEALPSVFEPFFTTRAEGTGLGLAIARRFTEQNGGRLTLASRPGEGTTVRFEFPVAPAAVGAVPA